MRASLPLCARSEHSHWLDNWKYLAVAIRLLMEVAGPNLLTPATKWTGITDRQAYHWTEAALILTNYHIVFIIMVSYRTTNFSCSLNTSHGFLILEFLRRTNLSSTESIMCPAATSTVQCMVTWFGQGSPLFGGSEGSIYTHENSPRSGSELRPSQ